MKLFCTAFIGIIIILWFIKLIFHMGMAMTSIAMPDIDKNWSFKSFLFQKTKYNGENTVSGEILKIFILALFFRLFVYIFSLIPILISSDATTFSFQEFLSSWNRWDATHYINLAKYGYQDYQENGQHLFLVFFPLYPWLLRLFHIIIPSWEICCLALSSLSYAVGCCFFYKTLAQEYNKSIAYKAIILLSVYPFAFFYGAMMTESLFFGTMSIGFYFIKKHNWLAVGIVGIFCALCRIQGIIIIGVAGVEFLLAYPVFTMYKEGCLKEFWKAVFTKGIFLLFPLIGNLIYLYLNYQVEGNFFQFNVYQREHWYHTTTYFTNTLTEILHYLTEPNTTNTMIMSIWLPELLLFFLAIALTIYGLFKHPLKYTAFLLVYTLINYSVTFLISGGRYMACAFPMFIFIAEALDRHPKIFQWIVVLSSIAMAFYMKGYFDWKQIM